MSSTRKRSLPDIDYIFVTGMNRSGSTAAGRKLAAEFDGILVGELHHFWRSWAEERTCACGSSFSSCAIWSGVAGALESRGLDPSEMQAKQSELMRLPSWRLHSRDSRYWHPVAEGVMQLIEEISKINKRVVDTSKHPAFLDLLLSQGLPVSVVLTHRPLVDIRKSWSVPKPDPDSPTGTMGVRSATSIYREAIAVDVSLREVQRRYGIKLKSSDVSEPNNRVRTESHRNGCDHSLAGNPNRFGPEQRNSSATDRSRTPKPMVADQLLDRRLASLNG